MVETGHFKELDEILAKICKPDSQAEHGEKATRESGSLRRQTFVFSATLSFAASQRRGASRAKDSEAPADASTKFRSLMRRLKFMDKAPTVVDLTTKGMVAARVVESRISCIAEEKDAYLYYFLMRYPGRTIVFLNAIDSVRRLHSVLKVLGVSAWPLHAQMQQRQRLKSLDRFRSCESGVLLATDVAARGLDIPLIQHVVHFHVPKTAEMYVHRSGRTARAHQDGLSVLLLAPEEVALYRKICHSLQKESGLPDFPVDHAFMKAVRQRASLAQEIDCEENRDRKMRAKDQWRKQAAASMDLDDSALYDDDGSHDKDGELRVLKALESKHIRLLKSRLHELLQRPLLPSLRDSKIGSGSSALLSNFARNGIVFSKGDGSSDAAVESAIDAAVKTSKKRKL